MIPIPGVNPSQVSQDTSRVTAGIISSVILDSFPSEVMRALGGLEQPEPFNGLNDDRAKRTYTPTNGKKVRLDLHLLHGSSRAVKSHYDSPPLQLRAAFHSGDA